MEGADAFWGFGLEEQHHLKDETLEFHNYCDLISC